MKWNDDKKLRLDLMRELKNIYDDKDFVCGSVSIARTPENWKEMLDYIHITQEDGEVISSDDLLLLALSLRKEADDRSRRILGKNVAAML